MLAADRLAYIGRGETVHCFKTKIHRLDDGRLLGISTSVVGASSQLLAWVKDGAEPTAASVSDRWPDDFSIILIGTDGSVTQWEDGFWPQHPEASFYAIGSGRSYALGAMAVGATAVGAVEAACLFDPFSAHGIDHLELR